MSSLAIRKPRPKVRALKEHEPLMRLDLDKAESLLCEMRDLDLKLFKVYHEFTDLVRFPTLRAASKGGVDSDTSDLFRALQHSAGSYLMVIGKQRDGAQHLMEAAVAAMRIYRKQRNQKASEADEAQA